MEKKQLLKQLLKENKETNRLDFKREVTLSFEKDRIEFAKDISAFANADGGYIVFGKEDPKQGGKIVGINKETFDTEQMQQIISNRCNPTISFDANLLQIRSKWFGLLSISSSQSKPHEIKGTYEVWIRRGDTTAKASEQEREFMRMQNKRKRLTDEESDKPSEKYKEKALTIGFVTIFLMFFLPFRLTTFWILSRGLDLQNWVTAENFAFVVLFVVVSVICSYFFENGFYSLLLRSVRRWALQYLLSALFFVALILILNFGILLYPETIKQFFQNTWVNFLWVCVAVIIPMFPAVLLSHFPLTEYFSALKDEEYLSNPRGNKGLNSKRQSHNRYCSQENARGCAFDNVSISSGNCTD